MATGKILWRDRSLHVEVSVDVCEKVNFPPSHRDSLERSLALMWVGLPHHNGWVRAPLRQWLDLIELTKPKWLCPI